MFQACDCQLWRGPLIAHQSRTFTNSKSGNSLQRLAQVNGFAMPRPVTPTQYEMSTMRASSSSSANSAVEILGERVAGAEG